MITTTLKALRENGACYYGYNKIVRMLQGKEFTENDRALISYLSFSHDSEIQIASILASNGLDDALWSLRACKQTPELQRAERLFGVWCARQAQNLMTDQRSIDALDTAERFANGEATEEELAAARGAAWAAWAADRDAWDSAGAAARDAAWAAWAAARDAARDAWAAWAAAGDAARAAGDAARDAQKQKFIKVFCGENAPNIGCLRNKTSKSEVV